MQGLDYNTQREKLLLPEYGREIQKMVDHAVTLPLREERMRCAKSIVRMMAGKQPQTCDNAGYQQMLWDHLYMMSHKQLDIDWPCDVSNAEKFHSKPEPMKLPQTNIKLRYYGRLIEELLQKLTAMPAGPERDELARLTANQMKRDLMQWGHGSMDDEKVADDLARLTDGVIQLDLKQISLGRNTAPKEPQKRNGGKKKR